MNQLVTFTAATRTKQLYDRRSDEVTLDEFKRVVI
jgi:hypothetical protein